MRLNWSIKKAQKVASYEKLAPIYDHVMKHVDYETWAEYTLKIVNHWHPNAKTILDAACGTGNLLKALSRSDYKLFGFDESQSMVRQAHLKSDLKRIPVWRAGLTSFLLKRPVDVILCFYDSLNYMMSTEEIARFLKASDRSLNSKGLLIFDICTERNAIEHFYNYYDHEKNATFSYDRWSHYNRRKQIQFTEFKIRFEGEQQTYLEVHQQRIYSQSAIRKIVDCSPFNMLAMFDEFSFKKPNSRSNRIHFVLQRKEVNGC